MLIQLPPINPKRLRLEVLPKAEFAIKQGHPWVWDQSFRTVSGGALGDLGVIFDQRGKFLAIGLWDPTSPIRLRVLARGKPQTIDQEWFQQRLQEALVRRATLLNTDTTGYRLVNGESDGLPGLVLDRYDTTFVLKLYTAAWLSYLPWILAGLQDQLTPERLMLRLSRNAQPFFSPYGLTDGQVLSGKKPVGPVLFLENGLHFEADVLEGQKTGFFLDQRENRQKLGQLVTGRRVLNGFSFSGGFSVYAAQGGCREVTSLDLSHHALEAAQRNFEYNPNLSGVPHHTLQGDAFKLLQDLAAEGRVYEAVILDPPSFAPRERDREAALAGYRRLLELGLRVLAPRGLLVMASCSAHVRREEFLELIEATLAPRGYQTLAYRGHSLDHPATFAEADYLKCWFGYVD